MARYDSYLTALLKPFAVVYFVALRAVRHDQFLRLRGLPGQRWWLLPAGHALRACGVLSRCWKMAFTQAALRRYSSALARHYGPTGLAYGHLGSASEAERRERFHKQQGRIRLYLHDRRVLDFADGDSFLDCGCGPGQNVAELRRAFPTSAIKAFDYNQDAVAVVRAGTTGDERIAVEQGSVLDAAYLASYPTNSVDHVLISHVMGFLMRPTLEETKAARQRIIDELARIARRTLIVLDAVEVGGKLSVDIEQRDRGFVHDDLTGYFKPHAATGQLYVMLSAEDEAIIFRKHARADANTTAGAGAALAPLAATQSR